MGGSFLRKTKQGFVCPHAVKSLFCAKFYIVSHPKVKYSAFYRTDHNTLYEIFLYKRIQTHYRHCGHQD